MNSKSIDFIEYFEDFGSNCRELISHLDDLRKQVENTIPTFQEVANNFSESIKKSREKAFDYYGLPKDLYNNLVSFLKSGNSSFIISALSFIKNAGLSNEKKKNFLKGIYIDLSNEWVAALEELTKVKSYLILKGKWLDPKEVDSLKFKVDDSKNKYDVFIQELTGKPSYSVTDSEIYWFMRNL
jgi:hypothetical protein